MLIHLGLKEKAMCTRGEVRMAGLPCSHTGTGYWLGDFEFKDRLGSMEANGLGGELEEELGWTRWHWN